MKELTTAAHAVRDCAEETGFAGVVRLERGGEVVDEFARGMADRSNGIGNELHTRFGAASATKGCTALTVMSLIEDGRFELATTATELVGNQLPLVDQDVTIAHLLSHTSGVGDYIDEEVLGDIDEHILDVSTHTLEQPTDYLPLIAGHSQVSPPGERFAYNNGAFIMLSLIIERVAGSFHDAVAERVFVPAGMKRSGFFRSDALPAETSFGYLKSGRTNVFHLPVIGAGDGGVYFTLDDVAALWSAFFDGRIVQSENISLMTTPVHMNAEGEGYGLGFWLPHGGDSVALEGQDAGVSFRSLVHRPTDVRYTIMSNTADGVWPLSRLLDLALT